MNNNGGVSNNTYLHTFKPVENPDGPHNQKTSNPESSPTNFGPWSAALHSHTDPQTATIVQQKDQLGQNLVEVTKRIATQTTLQPSQILQSSADRSRPSPYAEPNPGAQSETSGHQHQPPMEEIGSQPSSTLAHPAHNRNIALHSEPTDRLSETQQIAELYKRLDRLETTFQESKYLKGTLINENVKLKTERAALQQNNLEATNKITELYLRRTSLDNKVKELVDEKDNLKQIIATLIPQIYTEQKATSHE